MCMDSSNKKIDTCMIMLVTHLKIGGTKVLACCCGHNKYPMTIVADFDGLKVDIISNVTIPRKKRFYIKDEGGFYYIPEVVDFWEKKGTLF